MSWNNRDVATHSFAGQTTVSVLQTKASPFAHSLFVNWFIYLYFRLNTNICTKYKAERQYFKLNI